MVLDHGSQAARLRMSQQKEIQSLADLNMYLLT